MQIWNKAENIHPKVFLVPLLTRTLCVHPPSWPVMHWVPTRKTSNSKQHLTELIPWEVECKSTDYASEHQQHFSTDLLLLFYLSKPGIPCLLNKRLQTNHYQCLLLSSKGEQSEEELLMWKCKDLGVVSSVTVTASVSLAKSFHRVSFPVCKRWRCLPVCDVPVFQQRPFLKCSSLTTYLCTARHWSCAQVGARQLKCCFLLHSRFPKLK